MKRNTNIPYKNIIAEKIHDHNLIKSVQSAFLIMSAYTLYMDLDMSDSDMDIYLEKFTKNILDVEKSGTLSNFTKDMKFVLNDDLGIDIDKNGNLVRISPSKEERNKTEGV